MLKLTFFLCSHVYSYMFNTMHPSRYQYQNNVGVPRREGNADECYYSNKKRHGKPKCQLFIRHQQEMEICPNNNTKPFIGPNVVTLNMCVVTRAQSVVEEQEEKNDDKGDVKGDSTSDSNVGNTDSKSKMKILMKNFRVKVKTKKQGKMIDNSARASSRRVSGK